MRHRNKLNHLGRKAEHRKALMSNLAVALIMHKRIKTTLPKAKELRRFVEPLITRAKEDTTHNRRIAFRYLRNKYAVTELFHEVAKKAENRPGGYTRILKLGPREGDGAEMALIELVDFNEVYTQNPSETAGAKKRRVRRGGSKKKSQVEEQAVTEETVEETVEEQTQTDEITETQETEIEEKTEQKQPEEITERQENTPEVEEKAEEENKESDQETKEDVE